MIGQSNSFKKKLIYQTSILEMLSHFITESNSNNPYIVKEAVKIINTLLTFLDSNNSDMIGKVKGQASGVTSAPSSNFMSKTNKK